MYNWNLLLVNSGSMDSASTVLLDSTNASINAPNQCLLRLGKICIKSIAAAPVESFLSVALICCTSLSLRTPLCSKLGKIEVGWSLWNISLAHEFICLRWTSLKGTNWPFKTSTSFGYPEKYINFIYINQVLYHREFRNIFITTLHYISYTLYCACYILSNKNTCSCKQAQT